jgi:glucose/mannose transport system substrate-binding protein
MHNISVRALALAVMAAVAIPAAAQEPELKVNYNWTSPAETAAIKVLQEALGKLGVKWQDFAVVQHDTGANVTVVNMITGGTPPDVFLEASPGIYRDIKGMGMGFPLDAIFEGGRRHGQFRRRGEEEHHR